MSDKKWFKIGEAAQLVGVGPKDLRYWEDVIADIKPRRSKGNLRYYHVDELPRLKRIKAWLGEGLTVADCAELLAPRPTSSPRPPYRSPRRPSPGCSAPAPTSSPSSNPCGPSTSGYPPLQDG